MSAVNLAKENYHILCQAGPNAEFRVDEEGKLYMAKSSRVWGLFSSSAAVDAKRVEQTKLKAQIWGHLIPEIKKLEGKEHLSNEDSQEVQSLLDHLEQLRDGSPLFVDRMNELLDVMDKHLKELAIRIVDEPSEPVVEALPEQPIVESRSQQILEEIQRLENLFIETMKRQKGSPNPVPAPSLDTEKVLGEIQKLRQSMNSQAQTGRKEFSRPNEPEEPQGISFGRSISLGFGLGAGFAVGAARGVVTIASLPFRCVKMVADLISPDLFFQCTGLRNFSNAIEEYRKERVWIPAAREDGQENVAYTGPLEEFKVERRELTERPSGEVLREDEGWVNAVDRYPPPIRDGVSGWLISWFDEYVPPPPPPAGPRVVEVRKKRKLEGVKWQKNPLRKRIQAAGSELIIGSAKLAVVGLICAYALGRYGNNNQMCTDKCDLNEHPFFKGLWDALQESTTNLISYFREGSRCEYLRGRKLSDEFDEWDQYSWERGNCRETGRDYTALSTFIEDLWQHPLKHPMNLAQFMDEYASIVSHLKEPAKVTLLYLLRASSYLYHNPEPAICLGLFGTATAALGNDWNKTSAAAFALLLLELSQSPIYSAFKAAAAWDYEAGLA